VKYAQYSKVHVEKIILMGFLLLILAGTFLIYLLNNCGSSSISFIDAIFTSTSAVCVTGLTVVDTATDLTLGSQFVVMLLFQLGGLGVMTAATAMMILFRQKVGIRQRLLFSGGMGLDTLAGAVRLLTRVIVLTFLFEFIGSIFLFISFSEEYPIFMALYHSVFHSISAFCNAGFSTLSEGLLDYSLKLIVPGTIMVLIFLGGFGFIPLLDLVALIRGKRKIYHHMAFVTLISFLLIFSGTILLLITEWTGVLENYTSMFKVWNALFQSITARTAGFNTVKMPSLSSLSAMILCFLMIIGASPGSTGGGMKTTTFGILILSTAGFLKGQNRTFLWNRSVPSADINKAMSVAVIYISTILFSVVLLSIMETASFRAIVFEVISALGTVGLTMGITSSLSQGSKLVIVFLMIWGRVGILTLLYGVMSRNKTQGDISYPEINIPLG